MEREVTVTVTVTVTVKERQTVTETEREMGRETVTVTVTGTETGTETETITMTVPGTELRETEADTEKEMLFIKALNNGKDRHDNKFMSNVFFRIDMRNRQVWRYPHLLLSDNGANTLACIGSRVYNVGDLTYPRSTKNTSSIDRKGHRHTGLSYLDLSSTHKQNWKGCPILPSITPTPLPCVISLLGKLYVFVNRRDSPAAGVYDPTLNKWDTLLPPPGIEFFSLGFPYSAVPDHDYNRILVNFTEILSTFAYYPANKRWVLVMDNFSWAYELVFFNGVFYGYRPKDEHMFNAFDLATKQWLTIEYASKVPDEVWRNEYRDMLDLGNGLVCLIIHAARANHTNIWVAKFRFKRTSHDVVLVTPLPTETYTLDFSCSIANYLPI